MPEFASTITEDFLAIVPEFSSLLIVPLLIIATLLAVLIRKRKVLAMLKSDRDLSN
jgi:hypothetical protein